jgi:FkbM family methyltransferase
LLLPDHRSARPQWQLENGGWEVARIEEMLKVIKEDHTVFDIGTEEGDISALIAKYTKAEMVLIEPNDRVWSCIHAIWEANGLYEPACEFGGFFSSVNKHDPSADLDGFSITALNEKLISDHGFKQLYENYPDVPQITMDEFCKQTGIYPDVITMDVEGAEFEVIRGAVKTLTEKKPIIFMSVHPEFMFESYRNTGEWLEKFGERQHVVHMLRFIDELGYTHRCIEYDYHELHMVFEPKK